MQQYPEDCLGDDQRNTVVLQQWNDALTSNSSSICNSRPELFLRAAEQQQYDDDDVQGKFCVMIIC